jgi:hypothetical protein
MTRQKSDRRIVAKDDRKVVPTWGLDAFRGARATTVAKQTIQLDLGFGTAENFSVIALSADGGAVTHLRATATRAAPKPNPKREQVRSATMEEVASYQARKLIKLGIRPKTAWRSVYDGRKSIWALSHTPAVERGLRNAYFAKRGLVSLKERWREKFEHIAVPGQLKLALG